MLICVKEGFVDKLKKGDVLYDVYVNSVNKDVVNELVGDNEFLKNLQKAHEKLYERMNLENEQEAVEKGGFNFINESARYDGLYYNIYLFVEWLNRVL